MPSMALELGHHVAHLVGGLLEIGHGGGAGVVLIHKVFAVGLEAGGAAVADHLVRVHEVVEGVVGEGGAFKSPLVPQDGLEQAVVAARPGVAHAAEGGHDAVGAAEIFHNLFVALVVQVVQVSGSLLDGDLKGLEIDSRMVCSVAQVISIHSGFW